jgi:hypothetical protein
MLGRPIAGLALGHGALGSLAAGFPGARPEPNRLEAALAMLGESIEARAHGSAPEVVPLEPAARP